MKGRHKCWRSCVFNSMRDRVIERDKRPVKVTVLMKDHSVKQSKKTAQMVFRTRRLDPGVRVGPRSTRRVNRRMNVLSGRFGRFLPIMGDFRTVRSSYSTVATRKRGRIYVANGRYGYRARKIEKRAAVGHGALNKGMRSPANQHSAGIRIRVISRGKQDCIRGAPKMRLRVVPRSTRIRNEIISNGFKIIPRIVMARNGEVFKYPSAIFNSFPRDVNEATNVPHVERRSVLGNIKNIPLYVQFGRNFRSEQKTEEKERNGYVSYQHIRMDEKCGLDKPTLDIMAYSGSAGTKLLSCMGAQCAVDKESGNRVIPTKLEYRTYSFLAICSASENSHLRGLNPARLDCPPRGLNRASLDLWNRAFELDILGPALEFLDNIFATAHKRGLATEELGIVSGNKKA